MTAAYGHVPRAYGDWKDVNPINPKPPEVSGKNLGEEVQQRFPIADSINWLYQHAVGHLVGTGDRDLYSIIIEPLTGDFNRIRANGDAWATVGQMYFDTSGNLGKNSATLTDRDWRGDAADSFNDLIQVVWFGALYVAEQCSNWLKKGFDKLADVSIKLATKCIQILEKIFDLLGKLARKFIPFVGQAISIFKWIESKGSEIPYISDAQEIAKLIKAVIGLYDSLKKLVDSVKAYFNHAGEIRDAVSKIPDVNNMHDVVQLGRDVRQGKEGMADEKKNATDAGKGIGKQMAELDKFGKADS